MLANPMMLMVTLADLIRAIACVTTLDRRMMWHWIYANEFPERAQRPPATSKLDPY
ncbi:hypothetical protein IHE31_00610 (plasmid) [Mycetohabitans rhizoxinica]|uniref:hypothetical protein n=1 Tax=Mycetohabitans rhizoxinica TaxID=412963 RepID=UPI0030CA90F5